MKGILIGAMHKVGSFVPEGENTKRDYDNLILLLQKPMEQVNEADRTVVGIGFMTVEAKAPWSHFKEIFGGKVDSLKALNDFIGTEVNYFFDDKKRLDTVLL